METKMKVRLLTHTMNPEMTIACAGKLCYSPVGVEALLEKQSEADVERFVNMLVSLGHESPLEHASFTFAIEGVSRALTHQLVRHRLASYSQQSQRYVREKQFEYVIPKDIARNESIKEVYEEVMTTSQKIYDYIVDNLLFDYIDLVEEQEDLERLCRKLKIDYAELADFFAVAVDEELDKDEEALVWIDNKRLILSKISGEYPKLMNALIKRAIENARYIFPNATETKIVVTMNLRTLINFCNHRICRRAQEEIQMLAINMATEVSKVAPILGKSLGAPCQFGACPEGTMTCGKPYPKVK